MRYAVRTGFVFLALLLCVGCVGLSKLTPNERALVYCDDMITQYEAFHTQSLRIMADEKVSIDTKRLVAERINPKINALKPLITDYCRMAIRGGTPTQEQINTLITDIITALQEIQQ